MLKFLQWLESKLPGITISLPDPTDNNIKKPYLTRRYFFLKDRKYFNIFLHHFHRSDMDIGENGLGLLHSHPFPWSFSIVLVAGYSEERRQPNDSVIQRMVKPWSINFLSKKDFHRVDLTNGEAWTIFFTGPRSENLSWGFWDRVTKVYRDWKTSPNAVE